MRYLITFSFFVVSCAGVDQKLPPCTCNQECGDCACISNDAGVDAGGITERTLAMKKGDSVKVKENWHTRPGEEGVIEGEEGGARERQHFIVRFSDGKIAAFQRRALLLVGSGPIEGEARIQTASPAQKSVTSDEQKRFMKMGDASSEEGGEEDE